MKFSMNVACAMALALIPTALVANASASEPDGSAPSEAGLTLGAEAYDERCAMCHARPATIMAEVPGEDRDERAAWLDAFLVEHYAAEEEPRDAIIHWLLDR